jgi:hypothetical protein
MTIQSIINWIWNNSTVLFSGIGTTVLVLAVTWLFRRNAPKATQSGLSEVVSQDLSITQSPTMKNEVNVFVPPIEPPPNRTIANVSKLPPQLFSLPPRIGILPAQAFGLSLSQEKTIEVCLARFKLSAEDVDNVGHRLTASIEFIEEQLTSWSGRMEEIVCRVNQACWWKPNNNILSVEKDVVLELILGYQSEGQLYALEDNQVGLDLSAPLYGLTAIETISYPTLKVTLIDIDHSWKWRITFRLHSTPFHASVVHDLIKLRS